MFYLFHVIAVIAKVEATANPTCNGQETGSVSFSASGGTGNNFEYSVILIDRLLSCY